MVRLFKVFMSEEARQRNYDVLGSGYITQGPEVELFEYELSRFMDVSHLLTVNSGTSALQLALKLADVGYNDLVISTPMTCTATNTAIRSIGAHPVWADIQHDTGNISHDSVIQTIESLGPDKARVKAIMGVDWGGYPCDWQELRGVADYYDLPLIEDAAHAFGATLNFQHVGHIADFTAFSFQAIKHLTTGDGGALVVQKESHYRRGKLLRWFGIDREQSRKDFRCEADVAEAGFKYHMADPQAAIGIENLKYMPIVLEKHRRNGTAYDHGLKNTKFIHKLVRKPGYHSSYWIYTLHVKNRLGFMHYMQEHDIETSQVHARNDTHTMFRAYRCALPNVDSFTETQVNIPCGWWVTPEDCSRIIDLVNAWRG